MIPITLLAATSAADVLTCCGLQYVSPEREVKVVVASTAPVLSADLSCKLDGVFAGARITNANCDN